MTWTQVAVCGLVVAIAIAYGWIASLAIEHVVWLVKTYRRLKARADR